MGYKETERRIGDMAEVTGTPKKAVMTKAGRRKLCRAHAGDGTLPAIVRMAFGDGGLEEDGTEKTPSGEEASLYHELVQKELDGHGYTDSGETTCRYTATLGVGECTGKYISEIGLYDAEGDLVAIRTFLAMGKTEDIPLVFDMDEIF